MVDKPKYAPPFSLRLTFKERQKLDEAAGPIPIGTYIRDCLFETPDARARNFRRPVENETLLRGLLSKIGCSNLSNNLNQLAKACHKGKIKDPEPVLAQLEEACARIETMQAALFDALGLKPPAGPQR
jgi:hypothetical protein